MSSITNFFKPTSKKEAPKKKRTIQSSDDDEDNDFQPQPKKKQVVEVKEEINPSQYFSSSTDRKKPTRTTAATTTNNKNQDKATTSKKEKAKKDNEEDIEMTEVSPSSSSSSTKKESKPTKAKAIPKKTTTTKRKKKDDDDDHDGDYKDAGGDGNLADDSAPVKSEPEKSAKKASGFYQMLHREPPKALGSRPKPVGKDGCLNDMVFVISGEFDTLTKNDVQELIKTYGGRITSAVSGKTTYLIRGRDGGQSKLDKAKKCGTKVIDEDGFYDLIQSSKGNELEEEEVKVKEEKVKEVKPIPASKSSSSSSTVARNKGKEVVSSSSSSPSSSQSTPEDILWTEKYKPKTLSEILGNKKQVSLISEWLRDWDNNRKANFPEYKGDDEIKSYRAILISGPPGVGKTTTAQVVAKEYGYTPLEFNASDTRNKKLLEDMLSETTDNRTVTEFFSSAKPKKDKKLTNGKVILIMDEVDGMSGGDRGGSGALANLIRITKIPIICICNDNRSDKVKPLLKVCYESKFHRTPAKNLRAKFMNIAFKEKLKIEPNAIDELVSLTGNDIRQVINILSTYRLSKDVMKYNDAKKFGIDNQKYSQLSLFDIPLKLLSQSSWQIPKLDELYEVYFHDYQLSNLMIAENYIKSTPAKSSKWNKTGSPNESKCLEMDLIAKAANAIADGDLVDQRIFKNQEFSLMPIHSMFSCVLPSYYAEGSLMGNRIGFPLWLGQNSKSLKHKRLLEDITTKLRFKTTADEVRQYYIPVLGSSIFKDIKNGEFESAINKMDEYYLDLENLENISELTLGKKPYSEISGTVKRKFNKQFKSSSHPAWFDQHDTTPLKSKPVESKEDLEDVIFEKEEEISDSETD